MGCIPPLTARKVEAPPPPPAPQGCLVGLRLNVVFPRKRLQGYLQAGPRGPEHNIDTVFFLASASLGCLLPIKENEEEDRTFESLMRPRKIDHAKISKTDEWAPPWAHNVRRESGASVSGEAERKRLCFRAICLDLGAIDISDQIILCGGGLSSGMAGCLTASLAPTHSWNCNNQKSLQVLPNIPWVPSTCQIKKYQMPG